MAFHENGVIREVELLCDLLECQGSFYIHASSQKKPGSRPGSFHSFAVTASMAVMVAVTGLAPYGLL